MTSQWLPRRNWGDCCDNGLPPCFPLWLIRSNCLCDFLPLYAQICIDLRSFVASWSNRNITSIFGQRGLGHSEHILGINSYHQFSPYRYFPNFYHCQNTCHVLNITIIFERCRLGSLAVTPIEYRSKNLPYIFWNMDCFLNEEINEWNFNNFRLYDHNACENIPEPGIARKSAGDYKVRCVSIRNRWRRSKWLVGFVWYINDSSGLHVSLTTVIKISHFSSQPGACVL